MTFSERSPHEEIELHVRGQKALDLILAQGNPSKEELLSSIVPLLRELAASLVRVENLAAAGASRVEQLEHLVRTNSAAMLAEIEALKADIASTKRSEPTPSANLRAGLEDPATSSVGAQSTLPSEEPDRDLLHAQRIDQQSSEPGNINAPWKVRSWATHIWLYAIAASGTIGAAYLVWQATL